MPSQRTTINVKEVKGIEKVGQYNKLVFTATDPQNQVQSYHIFKQSLFKLIQAGKTLDAEVETVMRDGVSIPRVVQLYQNNQPVVGAKKEYRGKSPEELDQTARTMSLSYAKDLVVAGLVAKDELLSYATKLYDWVKGK
jgi:hypothetical protein